MTVVDKIKLACYYRKAAQKKPAARQGARGGGEGAEPKRKLKRSASMDLEK
ncbi:MAG: hypothetical protein ACM3XR_01930 [Bacillota bacterium]